MPRDAFADPDDTVRIDLSEGEWIDVRKGLSWGQELRLQAAGIDLELGASGRPQLKHVDLERITVAKMIAWITAWSFTRNGQPVAVDEASLRGLRTEVAAEMNAAVDAHINEVTEGNARPPSENGSVLAST
jgi:hypothetical protein